MEIEEGKKYKFDYPFVRCIFTEYGVDEDYHGSITDTPSWEPTTYMKPCQSGGFSDEPDYENYADAEGKCVFTVVLVCKPPGFPTRVLYTRKFITPDGKEFGKNRLLITTSGVFKQRIRGYRYQYFIKDRGAENALKRYMKEIPF